MFDSRYRLIALALAGAIGGALIMPTNVAEAASWTVNTSKSQIAFSDTQTGTKFTGHFTKFTAVVDFNPKAPAAGHAQVVIDTCSARAGSVQRNEALPGPNWFDCKAFPRAVFTATTFKANGDGQYTAIGTLKLRDITKPIAVPFTFAAHGRQADITGQVTLNRTDFGVGQGIWAKGNWVGLNVQVLIKLVATEAK